MGFQTFSCFIFVFFLIFLMNSSQGYRFYVGGRNGWMENPSESYNHWAGRLRFQVNDTLFFKFHKGDDSVLVVTRENYNNCITKSAIKALTKGSEEYKFERSGPHYFISANADQCKKGQRLIVVVLGVRHKSPPTPPVPAPVPAPAPMLPPPTSSPSPAPVVPAPVPNPIPAPVPTTAPVPAPVPTPAPVPCSAPVPAPYSQSPASGPAADTPAPSAESSFAPGFGSPGAGVVVSVAVGVGVILSSFVGLV